MNPQGVSQKDVLAKIGLLVMENDILRAKVAELSKVVDTMLAEKGLKEVEGQPDLSQK